MRAPKCLRVWYRLWGPETLAALAFALVLIIGTILVEVPVW